MDFSYAVTSSIRTIATATAKTYSNGSFLQSLDVGKTYTVVIKDSTGTLLGSFNLQVVNSTTVTGSSYPTGISVTNLTAGTTSNSICDDDTPGVTTKSIKGSVLDITTGSGLSKVYITTVPTTTEQTSATDGSFTLAGITSTITSITINFTLSGYLSKSSTLTLSCQNTLSNFYMSVNTAVVSPTGTGTLTSTSVPTWDSGIWDTSIWQ